MSAVFVDEGPDAGAVWHYGDPLREQRRLEAGEATVDLSHRPVFRVDGPDRLTWLHALTSQKMDALAPGEPVTAFILDPNGRIDHVLGGADDGETFWGHTEPGRLEALLSYLDRMRFAAKVSVADASASHALILAGGPRVVTREGVDAELGEVRAGMWAAEALRIATGQPRIFLDTDALTLPNEFSMPDGQALGIGVHLSKGCYKGQEAIARTYNIGRPPRRLVLLHLDGSTNELPAVGDDVTLESERVGRVGTSAIHYELGPIALALVKRSVPVDAALSVGVTAASQQVIVDPDVGLHVRESAPKGLGLRRRPA